MHASRERVNNLGKVSYTKNSDNLGLFVADDEELLDLIMMYAVLAPPEYAPGEYWQDKTANALRQLKKSGLQNFRSSKNSATTSFGDSPIVNVVNSSSTSIKELI